MVKRTKNGDAVLEKARALVDTNGAGKNRVAGVMDETIEEVRIKPPNYRVAEFTILGTSPYVQRAFSSRTQAKMRATQEAGSTARSKRNREAKDFKQAYEDAMHIAEGGWCGIPAASFRAAMIDACRLVNFHMTKGKQSIFIVHDGLDKVGRMPLVRIIGKPHAHQAAVRLATGVADICVRPMWDEWKVNLKVRFDADAFTLTDVTNLLVRAGIQCGVGEGRPFSKTSYGQGWGTFTVEGFDV